MRELSAWLTSPERPSLLPHGASTARLRNRAYRLLSQSSKGGMTMGQRIRPPAADIFASADFLRGILVVSSFGFWAVMLGLMPVLVFRIWLT
ncbi:hypothetical protein [Bradyrhizobium sp. SSUT77]|uniref:hypothetical protein n=1 Tax=Bradyrhizobium sp. SSUT77 TaxID=3040603 RepID=UPI0024496D34|nr:hypothetical protein [Bradyrhizobium sp. SSUT77]MDH2346308.1 hypothetical protein [Bradyrhizobium sp. SSUT77]